VKRGRFDLLHQLRQRRLEACRWQLFSVGQCESELESREVNLARRVRAAFQEQGQAVGAGGIDVGRVVECRRHRHELQDARELLARQRGLVQEVAEVARGNLEEAFRQVEVIEKLAERAGK